MNKIDIGPKIGAWGVWDKEGRAWIGNEQGPQTYADSMVNGQMIPGRTLARFGATIFNRRAGTSFRFAAKQYTAEAKLKKDSITLLKGAETALSEILDEAGPGGKES